MDIDRFISLRKSLGYTQKTFAACLGIPNTTADIERGKTFSFHRGGRGFVSRCEYQFGQGG